MSRFTIFRLVISAYQKLAYSNLNGDLKLLKLQTKADEIKTYKFKTGKRENGQF